MTYISEIKMKLHLEKRQAELGISNVLKNASRTCSGKLATFL
jgi:hypothetical protein